MNVCQSDLIFVLFEGVTRMKKMITRLARFAAVSAVFGSLLLVGPTRSSAEGSGVGSGNVPPPRVTMSTPDFVLYEDGLVVFSDGSYAYAW
jgi:hypothetical protein